MKCLLALLVLMVPTIETTGAAPIPSAFPSTIGKAYARSRRVLLAHGAQPVDLRAQLDHCPDAAACRFPELESCFADQPVCVFVWRAAGGGFLRVFAERDWRDPGRLTVSYIARSKVGD